MQQGITVVDERSEASKLGAIDGAISICFLFVILLTGFLRGGARRFYSQCQVKQQTWIRTCLCWCCCLHFIEHSSLVYSSCNIENGVGCFTDGVDDTATDRKVITEKEC